jgi:hypothetical protein
MVTKVTIKVVITTVTANRANRASQANGDTQKNAESPANKSRKLYKNRDSPAYKNAESPFMRGFARQNQRQNNGNARAKHTKPPATRQISPTSPI